MEPIVARIKWEGLEAASGKREEGKMLCRLEDVIVVQRGTPKWHKTWMESLRKLGVERAQDSQERTRLMKEAHSAPDANEIVSYWFQKSIQLSPQYALGYSEHPENDSLTGFGLTGGIGKIVTEFAGCSTVFSWDWFNVESAGKAIKIQESGRIRFEQSKTRWGNEIVHMRFDTDVSLRVMRRETAMSLQPDWRINIFEGTEIRWPSLIDGQLVANGYLD